LKVLEVYTDGSASPNPGQGAWAYCIIEGKKPIKIESGYAEKATNNQMELKAILEALKEVQRQHSDCMIYLYTDSQYAERGLNAWLPKWKRNDFNIKNSDVWRILEKISNKLNLQVQWIRSHNKNKWNEFVDKLCSETITNNNKKHV